MVGHSCRIFLGANCHSAVPHCVRELRRLLLNSTLRNLTIQTVADVDEEAIGAGLHLHVHDCLHRTHFAIRVHDVGNRNRFAILERFRHTFICLFLAHVCEVRRKTIHVNFILCFCLFLYQRAYASRSSLRLCFVSLYITGTCQRLVHLGHVLTD